MEKNRALTAAFAAAALVLSVFCLSSCGPSVSTQTAASEIALQVVMEPVSAAYFSDQSAIPMRVLVKAGGSDGEIYFQWYETDVYDAQTGEPASPDAKGTAVTRSGGSGKLDASGGLTELSLPDDLEDFIGKPRYYWAAFWNENETTNENSPVLSHRAMLSVSQGAGSTKGSVLVAVSSGTRLSDARLVRFGTDGEQVSEEKINSTGATSLFVTPGAWTLEYGSALPLYPSSGTAYRIYSGETEFIALGSGTTTLSAITVWVAGSLGGNARLVGSSIDSGEPFDDIKVDTAGGTYLVSPGEWKLRYTVPTGYLGSDDEASYPGGGESVVIPEVGEAREIRVNNMRTIVYPAVSPLLPVSAAYGLNVTAAAMRALVFLPQKAETLDSKIDFEWSAVEITGNTTAPAVIPEFDMEGNPASASGVRCEVNGTEVKYIPPTDTIGTRVYTLKVRHSADTEYTVIPSPAVVTVSPSLFFELQGGEGYIAPLAAAGIKVVPGTPPKDGVWQPLTVLGNTIRGPAGKPVFKGWTTENYAPGGPSGVPHGDYYAPGSLYTFTALSDETLYAVWSAETPGASGSGSEFVITAPDMEPAACTLKTLVEASANARSELAGHFILLTDIAEASKVSADGGPIGGGHANDHVYPFTGVFNGNGRTVNLAMTAAAKTPYGSGSGADDYYAGLFAYVKGGNTQISQTAPNLEAGTVKNLRVTGSVATEGLPGIANVWAGGIAGRLTSGNIYNVVSMAQVDAGGEQAASLGSDTGEVQVGGIIGTLETHGCIAYAIAAGDLSSTRTGAHATGQLARVGGISGGGTATDSTKIYLGNVVALSPSLAAALESSATVSEALKTDNTPTPSFTEDDIITTNQLRVVHTLGTSSAVLTGQVGNYNLVGSYTGTFSGSSEAMLTITEWGGSIETDGYAVDLEESKTPAAWEDGFIKANTDSAGSPLPWDAPSGAQWPEAWKGSWLGNGWEWDTNGSRAAESRLTLTYPSGGATSTEEVWIPVLRR